MDTGTCRPPLSGAVRRTALIVAAIAVAGCAPAASTPDPSPSLDAPVLEVPQGTRSIDVAVGQSVNFQVQEPGDTQTTQWRATTSDESVFQVIEPSDDLLTPESPGGLATAPGKATVSLIPPGDGPNWTVRITVADP